MTHYLVRQVILDLIDLEEDANFLHTDDFRPMTSRRAERLSLLTRSQMLLSDMYRNIVVYKSYQITQQ